MATWQKIHDFCAEEAKASPPDSEIGKKLFDRYFERDPRKILLTDDSLLGRSSFNAVFRILPLNFEQIESHSYVVQQDTSGLIPPPVELHPMDLV